MNEACTIGLKRVGELFVLCFPLNTSILWAIWFLLLVAYGCVSWILVHHWGYYGVKENRKVFAKTIYFVGGIAGFLLAACVILAFTIIK